MDDLSVKVAFELRPTENEEISHVEEIIASSCLSKEIANVLVQPKWSEIGNEGRKWVSRGIVNRKVMKSEVS